MQAVVFRAVVAIAGTAIEAGDDVIFDPEARRLCTLCQAIDPGLVLNQYEIGALIPLTPAPPLAEMVALAAAPPASRAPTPAHLPTLLRLK